MSAGRAFLRQTSRLVAFVVMLSVTPDARAQGSAEGEILFQQALLSESRGEDPTDLLAQACAAESLQACLRGAGYALEGEELEVAEEMLRVARDLDGEDLEVRRALNRLLAARGNLMWAARDLQAMEQQGEEVSFELGYTLHALGQHEEALERLREASAAGGSDDQAMAALYSAVSLVELERPEEAAEMARVAARSDGPEEVVDAARSLRAQLRGLSGGDRVLVGGTLSLSAGYDSNPVLSPDDPPAEVGTFRLWTRAGVYGEPFGGSRWALGGRISASRDQSFNDEARPFDLTTVGAELQGRVSFGDAVPQELRLAYRYSIAMLDGGQGVESEDLYVYNEQHAGRLIYSLTPSPVVVTRLRVQSGWTGFYNLARSGFPLEVTLGLGLTLLESRLKLYAEAGFLAAWTDSQYDRLGFAVSLAGAYLSPWWDLELVLSWGLRFASYPESTGITLAFDYTQPELARRDVVDTVSVEIGRGFLENRLHVALRYRFMDSSSSIDIFTYDRHSVMLVVGGTLEHR